MADVSRRGFLSLLAASPLVAPAALKALAETAPTEATFTIGNSGIIATNFKITQAWPAVVYDYRGQMLWCWDGKSWRKVAVS